jgi:hypothetical protein
LTRFPLLTAFGYDPGLLARLSEPERQRLASVAAGWLLSLALLAVPAGYTLWLVEHSLALSLVVGSATFLLVLNLLRVVTAGGGIQAGAPVSAVRHYRPGLAPATFLLVLAGLFAQPAQLPLHAAELDPQVDAYRAELGREHVLRTGLDQASAARFQAELAGCDFVVKRLLLLWEQPNRAARFTLLYCLLVLLPALFRQLVALDAVRAYELERYRASRARVGEDRERTTRDMHEALRRFPSFVRDAARPAVLPRALEARSRPRAGQLSLKWRRAP